MEKQDAQPLSTKFRILLVKRSTLLEMEDLQGNLKTRDVPPELEIGGYTVQTFSAAEGQSVDRREYKVSRWEHLMTLKALYEKGKTTDINDGYDNCMISDWVRRHRHQGLTRPNLEWCDNHISASIHIEPPVEPLCLNLAR